MLTILERMMNWVLGGSTLLEECDGVFEYVPTSKRTTILQRFISA
jgi:hypothetical protein